MAITQRQLRMQNNERRNEVMEKYEELEMEVIVFESEDVITTSIQTDPVP